MSVTIDTLKYVRRLEAVGVETKIAEAQAELLAEVVDDHVATKKDVKELELKLESKIKAEGNRLYAKMLAVMVTSSIGSIGIFATLMSVLLK